MTKGHTMYVMKEAMKEAKEAMWNDKFKRMIDTELCAFEKMTTEDLRDLLHAKVRYAKRIVNLRNRVKELENQVETLLRAGKPVVRPSPKVDKLQSNVKHAKFRVASLTRHFNPTDKNYMKEYFAGVLELVEANNALAKEQARNRVERNSELSRQQQEDNMAKQRSDAR